MFWIMAQTQGLQEVFQGLGREWQLSNEFYCDFQRFTGAMYRKNAEQMKSTSCDIGSSTGRRGMLNPISYLPVMTHFASMRLELTTRPQFGNEVLNDATKYLHLSDVAGALEMVGKALVVKCCVASDEVELVTGKIFLSFAESAVAYHLCEP